MRRRKERYGYVPLCTRRQHGSASHFRILLTDPDPHHTERHYRCDEKVPYVLFIISTARRIRMTFLTVVL